MTARIIPFTRPQERLIGTREVADRLGIGYDAALALMKVHGVQPSGKANGRRYITEAKLHSVLQGKR